MGPLEFTKNFVLMMAGLAIAGFAVVSVAVWLYE